MKSQYIPAATSHSSKHTCPSSAYILSQTMRFSLRHDALQEYQNQNCLDFDIFLQQIIKSPVVTISITLSPTVENYQSMKLVAALLSRRTFFTLFLCMPLLLLLLNPF